MRTKWILGTLFGIGLAIFGAQAASADDSQNVEYVKGQAAIDPIVKTYADIGIFAKQEGISYDSAYAKYGPMLDFSNHEQELLDVFGTDLLREVGVGPSEIRFIVSKPISRDERSFLEGLSIDSQVLVSPETLSTKTISGINQDLFWKITERFHVPLAMWPDEAGNSLHIDLGASFVPQSGVSSESGSQTATLDAEGFTSIVDWVQSALPPGVDASVLVESGLGFTPESVTTYINGGDSLGTNSCSASFTVTGNNFVGVATTKHCIGASSSYEGQVISAGPVTPASNGDMAVLRLSGTTATPTFITSATSSVDITKAQDFSLAGQLGCIYGAVDSGVCDTVATLHTCGSNLLGLSGCGMTIMNHQYSQPGDSGAGWISGSVARGVHWGEMNNGAMYKSVLSDISALVAFGIHVVTTADIIGIG